MKLYLNTSGQWILDGGAIPAGSCRYTLTRSGVLTIYLLNGTSIYKGNLTDLQREDGTTYSDEAEFLSECGDFFVNPLNPLKEDVEGLQQDVSATQTALNGKVNTTDIEQVRSQATNKVASSKLLDDELTKVTNTERPIADIFAHLLGRIETLEQIISASVYNAIQVNELSVVDNIKFKGADLFLFGTEAPAVTPDFVGQFFVNTTGGVTYQAKGIVNSGDWKQTSN